MALTRSLIRNAATPPRDARVMLAGLVVANADGSPRAGVLGGANPSIVSALPSMNVAIAPAEFVTTKGRADGVAIFGNDGTVNVPIDTAPPSNSRIDVIYVKHNDDTTGDSDALPVFGAAKGTAAASPTKPSIPTGALELATLRVYSGTTATNDGSNTLVNTYAMTATRGAVVSFRTKADLDLWTTAQSGQQAAVIATGQTYILRGAVWEEIGGAGGPGTVIAFGTANVEAGVAGTKLLEVATDALPAGQKVVIHVGPVGISNPTAGVVFFVARYTTNDTAVTTSSPLFHIGRVLVSAGSVVASAAGVSKAFTMPAAGKLRVALFVGSGAVYGVDGQSITITEG